MFRCFVCEKEVKLERFHCEKCLASVCAQCAGEGFHACKDGRQGRLRQMVIA